MELSPGSPVGMRTQLADLAYGDRKERDNHERIERHLGVRLQKLDKYNIMDWREIPTEGDVSPLWNVEQKARNSTFDYCVNNYSYNGKPTIVIGKHKLEHMKAQGNGVVYFDFTDKLMFWVFDEDEYATFDVEQMFVRHFRSDCLDKPSPVVHIPCSILQEVPG